MSRDIVSANGRAKVKGSFTPNMNHKYDKMGAYIVRELQKNGSVTVAINHINTTILTRLILMGIASKREMLGMYLVERVGIINHAPRNVVRSRKKRGEKYGLTINSYGGVQQRK